MEPDEPFVQQVLGHFRTEHGDPLPAITMHATMEAGTLAQKYPQTSWVSIGATCHDMHTAQEHIYRKDLKEFTRRTASLLRTL